MTDKIVQKLAYNLSETAELLSISKRSLYRQIAAGQLHAVKCGGRTLVPAESINQWLSRLPHYSLPST